MNERTTSEYEGLFAEFYDLLQPDTHEVPALVAIAERAGGPVLELGSGTGRLLLPLARAGLQADGIDDAPDMLSICRDKLERETADVRERVRLVEGDFRDLRVDRRYGMILASDDVARHLLTADDLLRLLHRARESLRPGGLLVLDGSVPDPVRMRAEDATTSVTTFPAPDRGTRFVSRFTPTYEFLEQLETDDIVLAEMDGDRVVREASTRIVLRWFLPPELRLALAAAGFRIVEERGSIRGGPLRPGCPEMVFLATADRD